MQVICTEFIEYTISRNNCVYVCDKTQVKYKSLCLIVCIVLIFESYIFSLNSDALVTLNSYFTTSLVAGVTIFVVSVVLSLVTLTKLLVLFRKKATVKASSSEDSQACELHDNSTGGRQRGKSNCDGDSDSGDTGPCVMLNDQEESSLFNHSLHSLSNAIKINHIHSGDGKTSTLSYSNAKLTDETVGDEFILEDAIALDELFLNHHRNALASTSHHLLLNNHASQHSPSAFVASDLLRSTVNCDSESLSGIKSHDESKCPSSLNASNSGNSSSSSNVNNSSGKMIFKLTTLPSRSSGSSSGNSKNNSGSTKSILKHSSSCKAMENSELPSSCRLMEPSYYTILDCTLQDLKSRVHDDNEQQEADESASLKRRTSGQMRRACDCLNNDGGEQVASLRCSCNCENDVMSARPGNLCQCLLPEYRESVSVSDVNVDASGSGMLLESVHSSSSNRAGAIVLNDASVNAMKANCGSTGGNVTYATLVKCNQELMHANGGSNNMLGVGVPVKGKVCEQSSPLVSAVSSSAGYTITASAGGGGGGGGGERVNQGVSEGAASASSFDESSTSQDGDENLRLPSSVLPVQDEQQQQHQRKEVRIAEDAMVMVMAPRNGHHSTHNHSYAHPSHHLQQSNSSTHVKVSGNDCNNLSTTATGQFNSLNRVKKSILRKTPATYGSVAGASNHTGGVSGNKSLTFNSYSMASTDSASSTCSSGANSGASGYDYTQSAATSYYNTLSILPVSLSNMCQFTDSKLVSSSYSPSASSTTSSTATNTSGSLFGATAVGSINDASHLHQRSAHQPQQQQQHYHSHQPQGTSHQQQQQQSMSNYSPGRSCHLVYHDELPEDPATGVIMKTSSPLNRSGSIHQLTPSGRYNEPLDSSTIATLVLTNDLPCTGSHQSMAASPAMQQLTVHPSSASSTTLNPLCRDYSFLNFQQ